MLVCRLMRKILIFCLFCAYSVASCDKQCEENDQSSLLQRRHRAVSEAFDSERATACPSLPSSTVEIDQAWVNTWISPAATLCVGGSSKDDVPECHCAEDIPEGSYALQYIAHAQGNNTQARCNVGVCPFGQYLVKVSDAFLMWSLPDQSETTDRVCVDIPCHACTGACVRGVCLKSNVSSAPSEALSMPKMTLYWGGLVGDASSGGAAEAGFHASRYIKNVLSFVEDKNARLGQQIMPTMVFNNWITEVGHESFAFFADPMWLVENWLGEAASRKISETGVVAYINPKDAGYNIAVNVTSGPLKGFYDFRGLAGGIDASNASSCSSNKWTRPSAGFCPLTLQDPKSNKTVPLDYNACIASNTCPPGCPNFHSQVMAYLGLVNKLAKSLNYNASITEFIFDGEDGGAYSSDYGFCLLHEAAKVHAPDIVHIGYAKALNSGKLGENDNFVMPESYWFMNEMGPCGGDQYQEAKKPPVCTSDDSYHVLRNKPSEFLQWLRVASKCSDGDDYLASMAQNARSAPSGSIQTMFSLENLGRTSPAAQCLASEFFGADISGAKGGVCGTFDGFAYWTWEAFTSFMQLFAHQYGLTTVGVYEAQFLPAAWFASSTYPYPYVSLACQSDADCTAIGGDGYCRSSSKHQGQCHCTSGNAIPVLCQPPECTRPLLTCPKGTGPAPAVCTSAKQCQSLGDQGAYCNSEGGSCHCSPDYHQVVDNASSPSHLSCAPGDASNA